jgi:hypothetical protein
MERLAGVLRDARERGANLDEVRNTVEREFPSWGQQVAKLLVPKTPSDLAAYITVILMIITMVLDAKKDDRPVDIDADIVINNITVEGPMPTAQPPDEPSSAAIKGTREHQERGVKVSRNQPCPCGSGLKFKKCHGAGARHNTTTVPRPALPPPPAPHCPT